MITEEHIRDLLNTAEEHGIESQHSFFEMNPRDFMNVKPFPTPTPKIYGFRVLLKEEIPRGEVRFIGARKTYKIKV